MALSTGMLRERAFLVRAIAHLRGAGFTAEQVECFEGQLLGHRDDGDGKSMTPEAVAVAAEAVDECVVRLSHPTYGLVALVLVWQGGEAGDDEQAAELVNDWISYSQRAGQLVEEILRMAVTP